MPVAQSGSVPPMKAIKQESGFNSASTATRPKTGSKGKQSATLETLPLPPVPSSPATSLDNSVSKTNNAIETSSGIGAGITAGPGSTPTGTRSTSKPRTNGDKTVNQDENENEPKEKSVANNSSTANNMQPMMVLLPQPGHNGTTPAFVFPNYAAMASFQQQSQNNQGIPMMNMNLLGMNNNMMQSANDTKGISNGMQMPFYGMPYFNPMQMQGAFFNGNNLAFNPMQSMFTMNENMIIPKTEMPIPTGENFSNNQKRDANSILNAASAAEDVNSPKMHSKRARLDDTVEPETGLMQPADKIQNKIGISILDAIDDAEDVEDESEENSSKNARWSHDEEIILRGCACDCNLFLGGHVTWQKIKQGYNLALQRFNARQQQEQSDPPKKKGYSTRTMCSIKKHFRIMYRELQHDLKKTSHENRESKWYGAYHGEWMSGRFNRERDLLSYTDVLKFCTSNANEKLKLPNILASLDGNDNSSDVC